MRTDVFKVEIVNDQNKISPPVGLRMLIRRCCNAVFQLEKFNKSAQVVVTLTDNEKIKNLNIKYRNKDESTDVLSFPTKKYDQVSDDTDFETNPETGAKILGDIVVSIEKAREQSEKFNHSLQHEIARLVVHAMFHLFGYDHETNEMDASIMTEREEKVVNSIGFNSNN
ncbi:MAG: rRNA maturation RNase YbeY [Candidatus Improbicoccus devescovinae]|nr:MAG: rRNA maturation RNase YbeY [Candidatus Improbicoccus devescovinae]